MQCIVTCATGMHCSYLKSVLRYKYLILDTFHPHTIFTWARMWGSAVIFRSQKGSACKNVWETLGWTFVSSNPGRGKIILCSSKRPHRFWGPLSVQFNGHRGTFPGVKRSGSEADHLRRSSAQVNNKYSNTSAFRIRYVFWRRQGQLCL